VLAALALMRARDALAATTTTTARAVSGRLLVPVVALVLVASAVRFAVKNGDDQNGAARVVLRGVHEMFPEPVRYLDRCGMVSSFPKVGPFMSTLTMSLSRAAGEHPIARVMEKTPPVFVLANVDALKLEKPWQATNENRLLEEDFDLLRAHYIKHWGPVWIAGAHLEAPGPFALALAGAYTVESAGDVVVDGNTLAPGSVVQLAAGAHALSSAGAVTLRAGDHVPVPAEAPPKGGLFTGFHVR
jgi:hypothetical protein